MSSKPVVHPRPPSVETVLKVLRQRQAEIIDDAEESGALVAVARTTIDDERTRLSAGEPPRSIEAMADAAEELLDLYLDPHAAVPEPVINATGVILHTNLGRATWPDVAVAAVGLAAGWGMLELDPETGRRGPRFHLAEDHLVALTGAGAAMVVNNNAAAVAIAVGLAGTGGVIVSRGELVEIGGGVRIPEIVERAGARLIEVGTTNRTRTADFESPLRSGDARVVLRVHPSNFTMAGFVEEPDAAAVARLAHEHGAIVVDDLGSGALLATEQFGLLHEPTPSERLALGADVVTFSGDKLIGGPQAGLLVGRADLIERLRRDPLARAMRPDKAILAAVAATLGLYRAGIAATEIPVWQRIATPADDLKERAGWIAQMCAAFFAPRAGVEVVELASPIGGGSLPGQTIPSWGVKVPFRSAHDAAAALRQGYPSILARVSDDAVVFDLRTVGVGADGDIVRRIGDLLRDRRMTVVVGTAGHIDHGKTTLLRALTGIDADRLPEERRRGMTIDVGYAHLALDDGSLIDFVDVPGHDKLVGNMLVGAGEIDAAMLVVAADDGPRAQTLEHVALLDALGIAPAIAVVTKIDAVPPDRVEEVRGLVAALLATTSLTGAPVLAASGVTGEGVDAVRAALGELRGRVRLSARPPTLAIDRVFTVKGRGVVVTGTLRGGPLARGDDLRLVPGERSVRIREIQVHGTAVERVDEGGRTALNLAGVAEADLHRGMVLTADPTVAATDRLLVVFGTPVVDRTRGRMHAGTAAVDATVGRSGRDALTLPDGRAAGIVRLAAPIAPRPGDRFVMRRGAQADPAGGVVLDTLPPRGVSRRRQTVERVAALADPAGAPDARIDLHGAVDGRLAADVAVLAADAAIAAVDPEAPLSMVRNDVARVLRRAVTIRRDESAVAAAAVVDRLVREERLVREGEIVRRRGVHAAAPDPALSAAMDRLESTLDVAAPPSLADAARAASCPPAGIRDLERAGRIVILDADLAYAMSTYLELTARAVSMAADAPLTPAAFRDATGTSRKYVMGLLEDLDRRAILRRTPAGHVLGAKAPAAVGR